MPLIVQSAYVYLGQTNDFYFQGNILPGNYAVGASSCDLLYPADERYNVRRANMSLAHGQKDETSIWVTVSGAMNDDNGHACDPTLSGCEVVVMAWVGSSDTPTVMMQ